MKTPASAALCLTSLLAATALGESPPGVATLSHRDKLYDVTGHAGALFVVGHPGHVLRSRDGGRTFEIATQAAGDQALFSIAFNARGQGAVVGRSGAVLTTNDGGEHWQTSSVTLGREKPGLFGVDVLDNGTIVAVGAFGVIVRSTDGGKTFQRVPYTTDLPQAAAQHADARGPDGAPLASVDAGLIPEEAGECPNLDETEDENIDSIGEARLTDVLFVSDLQGFAVGEFGLVLETTDGGATFHRKDGCATKLLYSLEQLGPEHVVAVGFKGTAVQSKDGGETWRPLETGTHEDLYCVSAANDRLLVVGAVGTVLVRDGDGPFARIPTEVYTWLVASWLNPRGEGLMVGSRSNILYTADGGRTHHRLAGK